MNCNSFILLPFLLAITSLCSCKKQAAVCTGNCETINARGNVVNKLTTAEASGVPVSLSWVKFQGGLSQSELITSVHSAADGSFNFTANIDTAYFSKNYFLSLSVGKSDDYIILGYSGVIEARAYSFDPNAFLDKQFEVFTKANISIRLHRALNDNFQRFAISHSNLNEVYLYDYNVQSAQEVIDRNTSVLDIETVADVYTKIKTVKEFGNGASSISLDSIKCLPNAANVYDLNF